jgi:uncharacterized protein (DUF4415 family)
MVQHLKFRESCHFSDKPAEPKHPELGVYRLVSFDVCTDCTYTGKSLAFEWDEAMKNAYDFSKGKRGRVLPPEPEPEGKTRITIRLDQDIVDRFFRMAEESGGTTGYQTLINAALREYLDGKSPTFEDTLRRIIREEFKSSAA